MCGIAGYIGKERIPEERLTKCLNLMGRRGPDHCEHRHYDLPEGKGFVELLHSRLSIIDLDSRSHQPLSRSAQHLAYNGELYNYREVREELRQLGQTFETESDTEVFLEGLNTWGSSALDHYEGMWAFALYDEKRGNLLLSRDRFGEKPLWIHRDRDGLYFASEVKMIFALLGRRLPVNYNHLIRHCVNGYKALFKENSFYFHGIEACPTASCFEIDRNLKTKNWRYWTPKLEVNEGMTRSEAIERSRELLARSMRLRLRADVPLAFCLSGGIDSNALASLAKKEFGYDVHGFSIIDSDRRYDESELIAKSVKHLGIKHTSVKLSTDNFIENLSEQINYHDAPICTMTYYAHHQLLGVISEAGFKISISGTGADESFSGYYDHHLYYLRHLWLNHPEQLPQALENWQKHILPHVRNSELRDPEPFYKNPERRRHIYFRNEEFSELLRKPWKENFNEEWYCDDLMRNRMMNEMFSEIVPPILREDDLNAMYHSVENRSPFLDRELYEFALKIPTRLLVHDGYAKTILREVARPYAEPSVIDEHRKVGFNLPVERCLDLSDAKVVDYLLTPGPVFDIMDRDRMEKRILAGAQSNSESKFLFNFLNTKIFLENFES